MSTGSGWKQSVHAFGQSLVHLLPTSSSDGSTKTDNLHEFVLEPLSTVLKLAILHFKPVGTKICIQRNVIRFNEPGDFQGIARWFLRSDKSDLAFLKVSIYHACCIFLSHPYLGLYPGLYEVFVNAQKGLVRLSETYRENRIYADALISYSHMINTSLTVGLDAMRSQFIPDQMFPLYTEQKLLATQAIWSPTNLRVVINLMQYITAPLESTASTALVVTSTASGTPLYMAHADKTKSLEEILVQLDQRVQDILQSIP